MKVQIHLPLLAPRKEEGSLRKGKGLENSKDGPKVGSDCTTRSTKLDKERSDESLVEFDKKLKTWFLKGKNSSPVMNHWWSLTRN